MEYFVVKQTGDTWGVETSFLHTRIGKLTLDAAHIKAESAQGISLEAAREIARKLNEWMGSMKVNKKSRK